MVWINATLGTPLGIIMRLCYQWTGKYGGSILLFTLISKVILLPLSIVVQKNSIKMIRMQPELNRITIEHYGDKDAITDGSMELYKREKYSPMLGIVPLVIQILLVLGLISVIYNPLQHLLGIDRQTCSLLTEATAQLMQVEHLGSGGQLTAMAALGDPANRDFFMGLAPSVSGLPEIMTAAARVDTHFLGLDLAQVPPLLPLGVLSLIPLLCGDNGNNTVVDFMGTVQIDSLIKMLLDLLHQEIPDCLKMRQRITACNVFFYFDQNTRIIGTV